MIYQLFYFCSGLCDQFCLAYIYKCTSSGAQFGTALQLMASGFIAEAWGWSGIFYVDGTLGAIWVAIYVFIGSSSPQSSSMISEKEKNYIQRSLGHDGEHKVRKKFQGIQYSVSSPLCNGDLLAQNIYYCQFPTESCCNNNKALSKMFKTNFLITSITAALHLIQSV